MIFIDLLLDEDEIEPLDSVQYKANLKKREESPEQEANREAEKKRKMEKKIEQESEQFRRSRGLP